MQGGQDIDEDVLVELDEWLEINRRLPLPEQKANLQSHIAEVEADLSRLSGEIDDAKAEKQSGGYFDPHRYAELRDEKRQAGSEHQNLLRELARINRELRGRGEGNLTAIRDDFAKAAMPEVMRSYTDADPAHAEEVARRAYAFANAMIAERAKHLDATTT